MITSIDTAGIDFILQNESLVLHPYLDSKGIPTIGLGCTYYPGGRKVTMEDPPITKEEAYSLFSVVSRGYQDAVAGSSPNLNQNQFNALFSFCYNIGTHGFITSTAYRRIQANPNDPSIKEAMLMWHTPEDIIDRRKREVALYFKPVES